MSQDINKKTHEEEDDDKSRKIPSYYYHHRNKKEEKEMGIWGILIFGLIGATATTLAITRSKSWKGGSGRSYRSSFQEEAWKRYNRRMQEEFEDEMERVERIRRMQSVFNREKNKFNRGYESWKENNNAGGGYHQHFQRNDWYWKTDTSHGNRSNFNESPRSPVKYTLSHHYAILGLSRSRTQPYTDDEIKTAFRSKAKQFHPDQNQENKDDAEARFKEVMTSYEAIKTERKKMK
nr:DnaJ domain-containing protein [Tanacetum cinerariifolium]